MADKIKIWRQKLLDTGKRNKLLNFKETKRSTLKITYPNIEELYYSIISGSKLEFPMSQENEENEQGILLDTLFEENIESIIGKNVVLSTKEGSELNKTLYQLRLRAKTALEELGTNILYLAFGFLNWSEVEYSKELIKSPLLLVPVELKKESILSPYALSLYEDDIIINPTLCYKLESDFGVKLDYDIDSDDFDLIHFFRYVSKKVSGLDWAINNDEVQLSLFSFLKLNMYKDLEKNEAVIMENAIVRGLCGESCEIEAVPEEIAHGEGFDNIINPIETFQVVDADSSQQQAILAAKRGISFVLQGPPGTGKSQTITNIIAECLADGKKILFVSEKMAALEVVYRNLQRVGLADFCLQLHSHKANKSLVVKELAETLNKPKTQANGEVLQDLEVLEKRKEFLNSYVKALHKIRQPLGKNVFQIHGEITKLSEYPDIQFRVINIEEKTLKDINYLVEVINSYTACLMKIGEDYNKHCFYGFCKTKMTFDLKNEIGLHFVNFIKALNNILKQIDVARSFYSLKEYKSINSLSDFILLLSLLINTPKCPVDWLLKDRSSEIYKQIIDISQKYLFLVEKENIIFSTYEQEILKIEADKMLRRFKGEYSSILRVFNSNYKKDRDFLKGYMKDAKKLNYKKLLEHLQFIKDINELNGSLSNEEVSLYSWLGEHYNGRSSNWEYLERTLKWINDIKELYEINNITHSFAESICSAEASTIAENIKGLVEENYKVLTEELEYIYPLYDPNLYDIKTENIIHVHKKFTEANEKIEYLADWIDFINARNVFDEAGIMDFLDEVENKRIPSEQWANTLQKRFYLLWIDHIYGQEKVLLEFRRDSFENIVADFQRKDIDQFTIAQARIREKLSGLRPDTTGFTSRGTEIHTLIRESEKRRKILPVRKLFEKIPNLLLTIKPCLLMSPLSVSLFLDPELYSFDTVIFDEASQVCSENAVGAIYRGKQLIVVGDREQLPPTNFFNASTSDNDYDIDDEEDNDIGAYESILDECGSILNKLSLLWHYRSRHEHLIAYSNVKIYKNLVTFPTPVEKVENYGVEFIHVPNGIYERSSSRSNRIEAKRVAELVFEHFDKSPERSLGIVTFSEAQQAAIDQEINQIRKAKSHYESFFDESSQEAFFVKNLENVQGDERDTIIFSVGYAKDQDGKMSMFFGPLNRDGGYRRLNVAITRAKFNVKLVSSILPTDIDLNRTQSQGVRMLRGYMEFALNGMEAILGELTIPEFLQFDSPFEMEVYDVLKNNGYKVDTQVGCSGYRIDLAVRHPEFSGKYVIAIECDGASYHSARTARERDRLREDVLKLRGWKIHRIWSTDWIRHRRAEEHRLLTEVKKAIENYQEIDKNRAILVKKNTEEVISKLEQVIKPSKNIPYFETYSYANIRSVPQNHPRGDLFYAAEVITHIVNTESPVHKEIIYRYMAPLYGREKVTSVVTREVEAIINRYCKGSFRVKGEFCWSNTMQTPIFRVPPSGHPSRDIKHIAPEELAEGMKIIVERATGIDKSSLFQEVSRALGFARTGDKITNCLNIAFDNLMKSGELELKGDLISIK